MVSMQTASLFTTILTPYLSLLFPSCWGIWPWLRSGNGTLEKRSNLYHRQLLPQEHLPRPL